jgi:CubicO group peptidase (beta-lactamase class C family)
MTARILLRVSAAALMLALLPGPNAVEAATAALPPARVAGLGDFVDGVMAQQIATRDVAGAVVTVVHDGSVLFTRGYGLADIDRVIAVDGETTLFRPGSVSKMLTWAALLQQVERGRVDFDADVNAYLDFSIPPLEGQPIRVRHLLSHTPGMSDVSGITAPTLDKLVPYGEWLKAHVPERRWAAGTEIAYSNYGAALAGYIVERVSGEPFADYAERHIFAPLGMTSTTFREPLPTEMSPRMATGYRLDKARLVARPFELFGAVMPAGSATTSAPDMTRFMLALLAGGGPILKPASVQLLMADSVANLPGMPSMAHGFYVVRTAGPRLVGHGGNTGDFHSVMILAPEARLGFFISETGGPGSYRGRTELADAMIGRLFPQSPAIRMAAPSTEVLPAGAYRGNRRDYSRQPDPANDLVVTADGRDAILLASEGQTTRWQRIGPQTYERATGARAGGPHDRLQFHSDAGGWRLSFASLPYTSYRLVTP